MSRLIPITFLAVAILSIGCATEKKHSKFQISANPYSDAVIKRTRSAKLYNQLDTIMIVDVIYNDIWLRNAWVDKQSQANRWNKKEKNEALTIQKNEEKQNASFVVALYTSEDKWNDLEGVDSRWSVFLESSNGVVRPASIKKVSLEKLPMRDNLPFGARFRTFYQVDFQRKKAGATAYNLVMSSGLGVVKLTWSDF